MLSRLHGHLNNRFAAYRAWHEFPEHVFWHWLFVGIASTTYVFGMVLAAFVAEPSTDGTSVILGPHFARATYGLVAAYAFDEGSGTTTADASGNGNTGMLTNGPVWTTGKYSNALSFDGTNGFVSLPNDIFDALSQGTIEVWVKSNSATNNFRSIFDADSGDCATPFEFAMNNGKFEIWAGSSGCTATFNAQAAISNPLQWHHLAYTVDGTGNKFYIDGVLQAPTYVNGNAQSTFFFSSAAASTTRYQIGSTYLYSQETFDGLIDDLRIYGRALTASEIQTDMVTPVSGGSPPTPDTVPPTLSGGSPSGILSAGTTQVTLQVVTNENATCKYGTPPNTAYDSLVATFSTTGGLSHSAVVSGFVDGQMYTYYVKCQDQAGNSNTADYPISFSVDSSAPAFNFSLALNPASATVVSGEQTISTVVITLVSGTAQAVALSASGLPAGATANFSLTSCTPACTTTITITTQASTPTGTSTVTVTGVGGGQTHTISLTITVNAVPPPPSPSPTTRGYQPRAFGFDSRFSGLQTVHSAASYDLDTNGVIDVLKYVDCQNGNDTTGNGSPANPYKTIQRAMNSLSAPAANQIQAVFFKGTCSETITPTQSGASGAYTRNKSGSEAIDFQYPRYPMILAGWDADNDGNYPPNDSDDIAVLDGNLVGQRAMAVDNTINVNRLELAHFTARDYNTGCADPGGFLNAGDRTNHLAVHDLDMSNISANCTGSSGIIVFRLFGSPFYFAVENVQVTGYGGYFARGTGPYNDGLFPPYSGAQTAGPWRFRNIQISGDAPSGPAPGPGVTGFKLWGFIDGVEVLDSILDSGAGTAWSCTGAPPAGGCHSSSNGIVMAQCSRDWTVRNNTLKNWSTGILMQAHADNYCDNPGRTLKNLTIDRNLIKLPPQDFFAWYGETGIAASDNTTVYNTQEDVRITNNIIYPNSPSDADTAGCFALAIGNNTAPNPGTVVVAHNTCHLNNARSDRAPLWLGLWPTYGTFAFPEQDSTIVNNVFAGLSGGGIAIATQYAPTNLVLNGNKYDPDASFVWNSGSATNFSTWRTSAGEGAASGICNPSFLNTATGDFHLSSSDTCAKDAGVPLTGITSVDYDGDTRPQGSGWDIGADEYMATAAGNVYYVDPTNGSDANPGTQAAPWRTIQKAANTAAAGDTVLIAGGIYNERITISKNGTVGSFITFKNIVGQTPIIDGAGLGGGAYSALVNIANSSYIRLDGLEVKNSDGQNINIGGASHHIEILNSTIHNSAGANGIFISETSPLPTFSVIRGNKIYENFQGGITLWLSSGGYYLIESNEVYNNTGTGNYDGIQIGGNSGGTHHIVVRNNIIHDNGSANVGEDNLDMGGHSASHHYLSEGNDIYGSTGSVKLHASTAGSYTTPYHISRYNKITGVGNTTYGYPDPVVWYNNTFYDCDQCVFFWSDRADASPGRSLGDTTFSGGDSGRMNWKNNIFSQKSGSSAYALLPSGVAGYNLDTRYASVRFQHNLYRFSTSGRLAWEQADAEVIYAAPITEAVFATYQSSNAPDYPDSGSRRTDATLAQTFVNAGIRDYHLVMGSPAIDGGIPLTRASTGGSGLTVSVDRASYFQDGYCSGSECLMAPDTIKIGSNAPVQIQRGGINDAANTITLTSPVTWNSDDPVTLAYSGTAPDIGAFEYASGSPPPPPAGGLVAAYAFDEGSGTIANDSSGNGNNGSFVGAPQRLSGANCKFGNCLKFPNGSNYVNIPDSPSLNIPDNLTISLWIKADVLNPTGSSPHPVRKYLSTSDNNFMLYYCGSACAPVNTYRWWANRGGAWNTIAAATPSVVAGDWNHLAVVYQSAIGGQLYWNGAPLGALTGSGILDTVATSLRIGNDATSGNDFTIDEVRIYNRTLTQAEIQTDMAASISGVPSPSFDFSLMASATVTASQGQSGATMVTAALTSGTPASLTFSASGLPLGATASFSPVSCSPNCSTTLTITTASSTPPGSSTVTVIATSPSVSRTTTLTLIVADTTAPIISGVTAGSITAASAIVTWTTNEPSSGRLDYGVTSAYGQNATTPFATSHTVILSSLSGSTTYHYRVTASDAVGNAATTTDQTLATLSAPDTILPAAVSSLIVAHGGPTSLNLAWSAPGDDGNVGQATSYAVKLSSVAPTTAAAWWTAATTLTGVPAPALAGTTESYVAVALIPSTTYYLAVRATDEAGNVSPLALSDIKSSTTTAVAPPPDITAPVISNVQASSLAATSATITWATDEPSTSRVDYGSGSTYGQNVQSLIPTTTHALNLTGLNPSATYHYRVVSADASTNTATSGDQTFTTLTPPDTTLPIISAIMAAPTTTTLVVAWTTSESADSQVEYGPTTAYGSSTILDPTLVTGHSAILQNLTASTAYHYRVKSKDAAGNLATSSDQTATTSPPPAPPPDTAPPVISGVQVTSVTANSAVVTWTTNEASTSRLDYGLTTAYGATAQDNSLLTIHTSTITGLTRKTTYHLQVASKDVSGNQGSSADQTFTTAARLAKPPAVANLQARPGSVVLSWTPDASYELAANLRIFRVAGSIGLSTPTGTPLATTSPSTTGYTDAAVSPSTTYSYTVFTLDDLGTASDPAMVSMTTNAPIPPSSGGGGGGGYVADTTPPGPATSFRVQAANGEVRLTWANPTDSDFVRTTIVRKPGAIPPRSISDGTVIYEGAATTFTDIGLQNDQSYSYASFTLDRAGNRSVAAVPAGGAATPRSDVTALDTSAPASLVIRLHLDRPSGPALGSATLILTPDGGSVEAITTGSDGRAVFRNLPVGRYTIQAEKFGHRSYSTPSFFIAAGEEQTRDLYLTALPPTITTVKLNLALVKRLAGRILLQVEQKGEAWYVNPSNQKRYYLGRPSDAFRIMREQGLGITNANLSKIPTVQQKTALPATLKRLSGRILLQVQSKGEAWYINPQTLKRHYLGRPSDAFRIMREQGLGITDKDLEGIEEARG